MAAATDYGTIWKEYKNALEYQQSMGFTANWPEYERFKMGDQWPSATPRTRSLPRPVINVIKYIIRNKRANVLSQAVKMVFQPEEMPEEAQFTSGGRNALVDAAQDFTDYTQILWHEIQQDELNERAVDDAATNGPGIFHYYWDANVHGGTLTQYVGQLRGEIIDAINVFFADPQQSDVQKQVWVAISSREDTDALITAAKANGQTTGIIQPDKETANEGYDTAQIEMTDSRKTTTVTKYYRQPVSPNNPAAGTEIWWTKVTENAVIVPPRRLSPSPDFNMTLYPIEVFNWETRKKCIYGLGEIEGLIPFQKALNFGYGMMLLSVQQTAWPKMIAHQGALQQAVTNEPGEIITDFGSPGYDNVKYMQPPAFSTTPSQILDNMLSLERTVTGTTEVMSGEAVGANTSAAAIIALQNQAKVPTQNIQSRLYRSLVRIGRIWEEFYKAYFSQPRGFVTTDESTGMKVQRTFTGTDYRDISLGLNIEVGPSSVYSESLMMGTLDKLYDKGAIQLSQYAKYAPPDVFPAGLKQEIENAPPAAQQPLNGQEQPNTQITPQMLAQLAQALQQNGQGGRQNG